MHHKRILDCYLTTDDIFFFTAWEKCGSIPYNTVLSSGLKGLPLQMALHFGKMFSPSIDERAIQVLSLSEVIETAEEQIGNDRLHSI